LIDRSRLPQLSDGHWQALTEAVAFAYGHTKVIAIIASGTIIRGVPDPNSDFDLFVLHDAPWRQRVQRLFNDTPCEFFINPPARVPAYFEEETWRPIAAHILATGVVVGGDPRSCAGLVAQAQAVLASRPALSAEDDTHIRYQIASTVEDARELLARDAEGAALLALVALLKLIEYAFQSQHRHIPRGKDLLTSLDALAPTTGAAVRAVYAAGSASEQVNRVCALTRTLIGADGFFAWDGTRDGEVPHQASAPIVIRAATLVDAAHVFTLIQMNTATLREAYGYSPWDEIYPTLQHIEADIDAQHCFVAERDGSVVGSICVDDAQPESYGNVAWHVASARPYCIHRLCVSTSYARQGIGQALVRYAEVHARAEGADAIRLDVYTVNPPALALYERLGYREVGATLRFPRRLHPFACMEKSL
jgi:ribosomal protein S18 acetylase RimI-like enzyme